MDKGDQNIFDIAASTATKYFLLDIFTYWFLQKTVSSTLHLDCLHLDVEKKPHQKEIPFY